MNFSHLAANSNSRTMDQICAPGSIEFQKHQRFVKEWVSSKNKRLLLFHGLGSGKTATGILAAKSLLEKNLIKRVHIVTPASLKHNYTREFASDLFKFKNIPEQYKIFSYQGFLKSVTRDSLKGSLVIVDEVQNVVSGEGVLYKRLYDMLVTNGPRSMYVLILSGTPMFDRAHEIALTVNLLAPKIPLPVADFYKRYMRGREIINQEDFMARVNRHVSAFKGASPAAYAKRTDTTVLCTLSPYQKNIYLAATDGLDLDDISYSQAFLSGPRMASSIVYPNGGFGKRYRPSDRVLLEAFKKGVSKFSAKFAMCISNIKAGKTTAFVYSNFVEAGGVADFELCLRAAGITSFGRFVSGKDEHNAKVVADFNSGKIRIILGSPAMKEGISLKNCRSVHILDPYWNNSRTEQIIGRAIRYCSHASLPQNRRDVQIFHYASHIDNRRSVDEHIMHISQVKRDVTDRFYKILYTAAVDCPLFHSANGVALSSCFRVDKQMAGKAHIWTVKPTIDIGRVGGSYSPISQRQVSNLKTILKAQGLKRHHAAIRVVLNLPRKSIGGGTTFSFNDAYMDKFHTAAEVVYTDFNDATAHVSIVPLKKRGASVKGGVKSKKIVFKTPRVTKGGRRNAKKAGCPGDRQATASRRCPSSHPFKRAFADKTCCFSRPGKGSKGIAVAGDKIYVNGRSVRSLTLAQLEEVARQYQARLLPRMRRINVMQEIAKRR